MDYQKFWMSVKSNLQQKNASNMPLQMWFKPTQLLDYEDLPGNICRFRLGVPTELHKYWISQNLIDLISAEISANLQRPFEVELTVAKSNEAQPKGQEDRELESTPLFEAAQKGVAPSELLQKATSYPVRTEALNINTPPRPSHSSSRLDSLNFDYTFSTFVVGRNNEFAHAASYNIAKNPGGENYNPLFICGPTGMGKTHLLHAVGNYIHNYFGHLRICYVSAERFLNECISSIRRNEMHKFKAKYRENCDVLLMDDIQILGRGEAVQEEFFHTLNDFFEKGKQVVVASDRFPKDIMGLEDRIRTRLEWGLIADIQMPDIETRVAILKYKAEKKQIRLPNDVVAYIARISKRSIRELEGNLNKVKMFSELQGLSINLELTKRVLSVHDETTTITSDEIKKLCAQHFKIRVTDLAAKSRVKPIVTARQVCMYLVKKHLDKSLVDIGRMFGGKDHTTVMNALRKIEDQQSKNLDLKRDIEELESRIHNITGV